MFDYTTLMVLPHGCETWSVILGEEHGLIGCSRIGC